MKPLVIGNALWLLAACGPGAGVDSFPSAYADAYCHFMYQCCTPADRASPSNPYGMLAQEQALGFADESDCDQKFGAQEQLGFQTYQASVADKRVSYAQAAAQACLNAIAKASSACDPNAFDAANHSPGDVCDPSTFFTGLVATSGSCTVDADCALANSKCVQPQNADATLTSGGSCVPPPAVGAACVAPGPCAAGACCNDDSATCSAYVAEGAVCASGCSNSPCDPSQDYCNDASLCAPLIANGGPCVAGNLGIECASGNCDATHSSCAPPSANLQLCVGNPDGL